MRPLLIGFTVRALAQSAVRAGAAPVAVDYFADRDLQAVCPGAFGLARAGLPYSPGALAAAAAERSWDAVIYTGGLENHPAVVGELARRATLLGNGPDVLTAVRDWRQVSATLQRAGFRVPVTLPPGAAVPAEGAWLEKPLAGSGGMGIAPALAGSRGSQGGLVQERVAGAPGSALFVADGRREARLLAVTELLTARLAFGGGPFHYAGNILLPDPAPALRNRLAALCQWLTAQYGLVGLNGVDYVWDGSDPAVIEVNPRYTAAMELVEMAAGCSLFRLHVQACQGVLPGPLRPWEGCWGKAILYGDRPSTWQFTGDWSAAGLRDLPFPGEAVRAGQPVCTVLAQAPSREACLRALEARARAVREESLV